jgi:TolB-like protein/tetratricopeptide (TPR) repeat protein
MGIHDASVQVIRFGPFEADLLTRELRKNGVNIKLQEQPFAVLAALLRQPGRVFSRADLQAKVWPPGVVVDFERGINKAMNRLREALGDSAEQPRFIETLPKRGYRFIGTVQQRVQSIAVLPFDSLSPEHGQVYWADGLADGLIHHLSRLPRFRVISRTSVMRLRSRQASVNEIGQQLDVETVLEGSVCIADGRIRVRVQLVDVATDRSIWAETYDREIGGMLDVQDQIAQDVARRLQEELASPDASISIRRRMCPAAHEAYLKGRYFWNQRTHAALVKSIGYFHRACELDSACAPALAGLANVYVVMGILGICVPSEVFPRARAAAEKALVEDPDLSDAHESLAAVRSHYDWEWSDAEREFELALQLNPNSSIGHQWYAGLLATTGRYEEAIGQAVCARDLDPLSPLLNAFVGLILMKARRYDEALARCRDALELDADHAFSRWIFARALDARGDLDEAVRESDAASVLAGGELPYSAHAAYAHARVGDRSRALDLLRELQDLGTRRYVCAYDIAVIHMALGETDAAFDCLEDAFRERAVRLCELGDPAFDLLRRQPRFQDLARRVGLPLRRTNAPI